MSIPPAAPSSANDANGKSNESGKTNSNALTHENSAFLRSVRPSNSKHKHFHSERFPWQAAMKTSHVTQRSKLTYEPPINQLVTVVGSCDSKYMIQVDEAVIPIDKELLDDPVTNCYERLLGGNNIKWGVVPGLFTEKTNSLSKWGLHKILHGVDGFKRELLESFEFDEDDTAEERRVKSMRLEYVNKALLNLPVFPGLNDEIVLCCIDVIIFSAVHSGVITEDELMKVFEWSICGTGSKVTMEDLIKGELKSELSCSEVLASEVENPLHLNRGDIVCFENSHYALATGDVDKIYSLYDDGAGLCRVKLQDLLAKMHTDMYFSDTDVVYVYTPRWQPSS